MGAPGCEEVMKMPLGDVTRSKKKNIPPPFTLQEVRHDPTTPEQVNDMFQYPAVFCSGGGLVFISIVVLPG